MTGSQIGGYRIVSLLGSGGMGEVYRAEDTRLGREVAIKILPSAFTADPDRLARFEREARVLASLNHPNIAAIHGVEHAPATAAGQAGVQALVLELVEGQTLGERIAGGLSITESVAIGRQIIEALDGAHEKGVVHRDLKPANIKITPDGVVKVLDFGLAKSASADGARTDLSKSPTAMAIETLDGALLGTAAYMSPEQARGRPLDKRTDIWAFGCVLFEMLTAQPAFGGATVPDIVAAILEREPAWHLLPAHTPASVRTLLTRCLEKDVRRRLRDIADARPELDASAISSTAHSAGAMRPASAFARTLPWLIAATAVLVAVVLLFGGAQTRTTSSQPTRRVSFVAPPGMTLTPRDASAQPQFVLSPDGSRIAFVGGRRGEASRVWVQTLASGAVQAVQGSEEALGPFWSYDGRSLAFFLRGKLKRAALDGGAPQDLADVVPDVNGGTWSQDDVIVFGGPPGAGLLRVSANGGPVTAAAVLDASRKETGHRWPQFLPDGRRFLLYVRSSIPANSGVYLGALDNGQKRHLLPSYANALYSGSGHLLFEQNGSLAAQRFDPVSGQLMDSPLTLGDSLRGNMGSGYLPLSVASDGTLAYWDGRFTHTELLWVDRGGRSLGKVGESMAVANPSLSPDAARLLVTQQLADPNATDLWRIDLATGLTSRLTFSGLGRFGIWSADGRSVVFSTLARLFEKPAGGGADTPVTGTADHYAIFPDGASRDGHWLIYAATGQTGWDIWGLSLVDRKSRPIVEGPASQVQASVSPDGRWLAYASDESGSWEVYVQPFPDGGAKWQVSGGGGSQPRWRRDSREIYYVNPAGDMTAVTVNAASTFDIGARTPLFRTRVGAMLAPFRINYDVAPDGQRFLINSPLPDADPTRVTLVLNWESELGGRARTGR